MAPQQVRLHDHPARPVGSLLAVSLCLAVGLLLISSGTALGISGFASPGPAVNAQYPDLSAPQPGLKPAISSLGAVIHATHVIDRDPKVAARVHRSEREMVQKAQLAVLSSAGINTVESGSIALLLAGIGVLSFGGVLRWRRGAEI